jgi:hypothetical protein
MRRHGGDNIALKIGPEGLGHDDTRVGHYHAALDASDLVELSQNTIHGA